MNAVPVEVKAETNVRSQSLKAFYDKFHPEKSIRFSLLPYKEPGLDGEYTSLFGL